MACTDLPEKPSVEEGEVALTKMPTLGTIPAGYGDLVAVSVSADYGHIFELWFQNEVGDIHIAFYNIRTNELQGEGRRISRSQEGE